MRRTAAVMLAAAAAAGAAVFVGGCGRNASFVGRPTYKAMRTQLSLVVEPIAPTMHFAPGRPLTISDGHGGNLTAVIGSRFHAADGYGQLVFFWHGTRFIGRDRSRESMLIRRITSPRAGVFRITYDPYTPTDAACCPSRSPVTVTYSWAGSKFVILGRPPGGASVAGRVFVETPGRPTITSLPTSTALPTPVIAYVKCTIIDLAANNDVWVAYAGHLSPSAFCWSPVLGNPWVHDPKGVFSLANSPYGMTNPIAAQETSGGTGYYELACALHAPDSDIVGYVYDDGFEDGRSTSQEVCQYYEYQTTYRVTYPPPSTPTPAPLLTATSTPCPSGEHTNFFGNCT